MMVPTVSLVRGVGRALFVLTKAVGPMPHDAVYDERYMPLGADNMQLFARTNGIPPAPGFVIFVEDVVDAYDLSWGELVVSYVLLENALRSMKCSLYTYTTRPLFLAAVGVAMKICTEHEESSAEWAGLLAEVGVEATPRRLGKMERLMLRMLDYRVPFDAAQYSLYATELVAFGDQDLQQ